MFVVYGTCCLFLLCCVVCFVFVFVIDRFVCSVFVVCCVLFAVCEVYLIKLSYSLVLVM